MLWNKVTLVGVGLLGGSLGLALKRRHLARQVVGYVRRPASLTECRRRRAVDLATLDLAEAVRDADLVILCTPLAQMRDLTVQLLPALKPGALVTDVGSVKAPVVRALEPLCRRAGAHFVGSHPMAGSEQMGVAAARAALFDGALCVLTPTERTNVAALGRLEAFWQSVGARTLRLTPAQHDRYVSRASHLPHLIAASLVQTVLEPGAPPAQAQLCATGFRDTTRVASGSPEMWRDIALANRQNLARGIDQFMGQLAALRQLLTRTDQRGLDKFLATAKQRRDAWAASSTTAGPE